MRKFKQEIVTLIEQKSFADQIDQIHSYPAQKTLNVLFSSLCSTDETVKKHAILCMGEITARLTENDIDSGRAVMRRLIWSLNEESGWIGWGSAQAMGEIMARNEQLAKEYHRMLISYITEGENYLLFDELRKEVVSGLKRLAEVRPDLVNDVYHLL